MSKEVSNEEINDKELESPVTDETGESRADEAPGQAQEIEDEAPTDEPEEELPPPTPEELKQLRADAAKAGEYYERLLRQVAETDNLRKRLAKEKQDAIRYANESLIEQLLPTMDSFDMAMMAVNSADETSIDSLKTGIEMVHMQLKRTLEEVGLTEIDATGQILIRPCMRPCHARRPTKRRRSDPRANSQRLQTQGSPRAAGIRRGCNRTGETMSQRRAKTNNGQGRLLRIARRQERRLGG